MVNLNAAQEQKKEFRERHSKESRRVHGVWRWAGMQDYKDVILPIIMENRPVIDYGGALGPLGYGSIVVDVLDKVEFIEEAVKYHTLTDFELDSVGCAFSSHTLEHVSDPLIDVDRIYRVLRPGGYMILHLPAYTCERWLPENHTGYGCEDHRWSFALSKSLVDDTAKVPRNSLIVDCWLEHTERWAWPFFAEYCGDNSIMLIARKRGHNAN